MPHTTIADFFQDESERALRQQVAWLTRVVGVGDPFFSRLLRTTPSQFASWRASRADLPPEYLQTLRHLWQTMLHLLSFVNFQEDRLRELFTHVIAAPRRGERSPVAPPWSGWCLREFLEDGGESAIDQLERWVTGLRFGDPYAA